MFLESLVPLLCIINCRKGYITYVQERFLCSAYYKKIKFILTNNIT